MHLNYIDNFRIFSFRPKKNIDSPYDFEFIKLKMFISNQYIKTT